jgi:hypothetical protein
MFDEEFARTNDPEDYAEAARWRAEVTRLTPLVNSLTVATQGGFADRGLLAAEGPESVTPGVAPVFETAAPPAEVTIQGPNGPVTVAAAESDAMFPTGTPSQPTPLTFGPRLGAMPQTQEEIMIDDFVRTQPARGTAAPPPPKMGQPGQPGKVITDLLTQRDQHVQWAQALIAAGQYNDARAVQEQIAATDSKLEAAVARQAIEEARDYNAPQRLNAIWSEYTARNHEFVPVAPGVFDVYVDGQLQFPGRAIDEITEETLMISDQVFAQRQADLAAMYAEAQAKSGGTAAGEAPFNEQQAMLEADIAVTQAGLLAEIEVDKDMRVKVNDLTKQRLETALREQGILPQEAREFTYKDTQAGGIVVLDGGTVVVEYVPQVNKREDGTEFVTLVPVNQ